ncbi:response regulator [Acaryochloris sp. CCMEE 5410]|uniref:response regulator n=1 Tax=Acaryochloris sp. CCMEE 5410 TaxID=310037 RepID=UPI0002483CF3|nr:response regulator transcription factor [Acaryochloris sp. CCMEE 5410]KAI9132062.1 response regulator transcription factor [Acaryochloris sp. CCMEE 5410]
MKPTILIVEDEKEIAQLVRNMLETEGFICETLSNGADALRVITMLQPDLVILDLMLPGLDGLEVCSRIRQQSLAKDPYILMLTARAEELDRIIGLTTGADDYLTKPFSPRELIARVRALLRRSLRGEQSDHLLYRTGSFTVDVEHHIAQRHLSGQEAEMLDLTSLEFKLLQTFLSYPGRAWSRTQLIDNLWGNDFFGDDRVVDTQVARLRKKIEVNPTQPQFIKTIQGVGYKFEDGPC